ncbi:Thiamine monophosphate synthase [Fragilaria crotonensis]|nr:Thiamine monophosphate synthase [Fragilaria crotonensis]
MPPTCQRNRLAILLILSTICELHLPMATSWTSRPIQRRIRAPVWMQSSSSSSNWLTRQVCGPPFLAIITEPNTCDSQEHMNDAFKAIEAAVSTELVSLVSIRIVRSETSASQEEMESRVKELTKRVLELQRTNSFHLVVSSDWVATIDSSLGVGVHVKESHRAMITSIRKRFGQGVLIGTSAHSIESAVDAVTEYAPDYLFVGTCYETQSHPEKGAAQLEGPSLPGQVAHAIRMKFGIAPIVLAIGGIDETNCSEPVSTFGADGVAVIRAVLQASNPTDAVRQIHRTMQVSGNHRHVETTP